MWKSVSSFKYYQGVMVAPFRFSFKYFVAFSLGLGFIMSFSLGMVGVPALSNFASRFAKRAPALYPQDLVITLKKGQLSTNVTEPLKIPIPYELLTDVPGAVTDAKQQYLLTIDTAASADAFFKYQSLALLTKTEAVVADGKGGYQVMPLSEWDDVTVNKQGFTDVVSKVVPVVKWLPILLIVVMLLFFCLLWPCLRFLGLLVLSILVLMASRLMNVEVTYKKALQLSLHGSTLPTLLQLLLISFGLVTPVPFFNSILFLLFMLVVLADLKKNLKRT